MKIKLRDREQLNIAFCKLRDKIKIASEDEERQFAMFKKIIRENITFEDDPVKGKLLVEKEEFRDQKVIEIAFKRLELIEKCKKVHEENCERILSEIDGISKTFDEGEAFSLRRREHEADGFKPASKMVESLGKCIPGVISKVNRARRLLEDESRRSVGVGDVMIHNPIKIYFDTK